MTADVVADASARVAIANAIETKADVDASDVAAATAIATMVSAVAAALAAVVGPGTSLLALLPGGLMPAEQLRDAIPGLGGITGFLLLPMLAAWMRLLLGVIERGRPGISRPRPLSGLRVIAAGGFTILFLFFLVTTVRAASDLRDIQAEAPVVGPIVEGMVVGALLWALYAVAISTLRGDVRRRSSERKMGGLLR